MIHDIKELEITYKNIKSLLFEQADNIIYDIAINGMSDEEILRFALALKNFMETTNYKTSVISDIHDRLLRVKSKEDKIFEWVTVMNKNELELLINYFSSSVE